MESRKYASRLRRRTVALLVAAAVIVGMSLSGAGTAHADQTYLPCPMPVAGAACGFEGSVSEGTVIYRYATAQGYGEEKQDHQCFRPTCWIGQHAVGSDERTPAGFEVRARGAFVSWREYS